MKTQNGIACEWEECNAMQGGWGEYDEVHCKDCTQMFMDNYEKDTGDPLESVEAYLDGAHRGGFIPVIIHGVICEHCGKKVK